MAALPIVLQMAPRRGAAFWEKLKSPHYCIIASLISGIVAAAVGTAAAAGDVKSGRQKALQVPSLPSL
jgi:hypothetical protein